MLLPHPRRRNKKVSHCGALLIVATTTAAAATAATTSCCSLWSLPEAAIALGQGRKRAVANGKREATQQSSVRQAPAKRRIKNKYNRHRKKNQQKHSKICMKKRGKSRKTHKQSAKRVQRAKKKFLIKKFCFQNPWM